MGSGRAPAITRRGPLPLPAQHRELEGKSGAEALAQLEQGFRRDLLTVQTEQEVERANPGLLGGAAAVDPHDHHPGGAVGQRATFDLDADPAIPLRGDAGLSLRPRGEQREQREHQEQSPGSAETEHG